MFRLLARLLEPEFVSAIPLYALILTALLITLYRRRDFLAVMMLVFFFFCSTLIMVEHVLNMTYLTTDALETFIPNALQIANGWRQSIVDSLLGIDLWQLLTKGTPAYVYPLALVFFFTNNSLIAACLFSTVFGILVVREVFLISQHVYGDRTARWTAGLLVFSPYFVLLSTLILRDTMAIFFLVWFFRLWMDYDRHPAPRTRWWLVFSLLYLGLLRPPVMLVVLFVVILYKIYFSPQRRAKILKLLSLGVVAVALTFALNHIMHDQDLSKVRLLKGVTYADFEEMNRRAGVVSSARSSYWVGLKYNTYIDAVTYMPLLVIYFMCSPFPWEVTKASQVAALIDSGVLWILYFFFLLEIRSFIRRNKKWAAIILTYLVLGVASASLVQGNVGGAMRHRTLFTVLMLPMAAHSLLTRLGRRNAAVRVPRYSPAGGDGRFGRRAI